MKPNEGQNRNRTYESFAQYSKSTSTSKDLRMLLYAVSACLWLLASGEESIKDEQRVRFHNSSKLLLPNYFIAPEISNSRLSFFVLESMPIPQRFSTPVGLYVRIRRFDEHRGVEPIECQMNRSVSYDTKNFGVDEFRRLSDFTFVFTWYEESWYGDYVTHIVYGNVRECVPIEYPPNPLRGKTYLVHTIYENFDVIVRDPALCQQVGRTCRVRYDPYHETNGTIMPFRTSLEWETLHVDHIPFDHFDVKGNEAFVIGGNEGDDYKIVTMDQHTDEVKYLWQLPDEDRQLDIVFSGMASCFVRDQRRRYVLCHMNDRQGRVDLVSELRYDGPVGLVSVVPLKNKERELFVLTMPANCTGGDDCWLLKGTRVKADTKKYEHVTLVFACSEEKSKLMIFDAVADDQRGLVELHYGCRNGQSYTFSTLFIYVR